MNKFATTILGAGFIATLVAAPASAGTTLLSETFSYADGGITTVSAGNWLNHSGTGTDVQIVSSRAVGDMNTTPDVNRSFAAQSATAKTYACFTVTIPAPAVAGPPRTNYFLHMKDTGTTNFVARVFVTASGGSFTLGISASSSTIGATWPTALTYGQPYSVVTSYNASTGTAEMWVNPVTEASPAKITATGGAPGTLVSAVALRQSSTGTGSLWTYIVDDLGVGTTFGDACVLSAPTPTQSTTWGRIKTIYR